MPFPLQGTRIGRARIRASGADAAGPAAGFGTLLASLDLEPPSMPPHAILCVRAMRDPLPDAIDVRAGRARQRPFAWESAMRAALGALLPRAARPIDGPVPADAEAVFFADESEMLACAARDVCRGPLSWFWWWRHLLPDASFERVVAAWHAAPTSMPAAFASLTRVDAAASWIRRLPPSSAAALLDAMLRAYALPRLADRIAAVWREPDAQEGNRHEKQAARREVAVASEDGGASRLSDLVSPWRTVVPSEWDSPALLLASRTFAAMCIVLRRAPWLARGDRFLRTLVPYLQEARRTERRDRDRIESVVHRKDADREPHAPPFVPRAPGGAATAGSQPRALDASGRRVTTGPSGDVRRMDMSRPALIARTVQRKPSTARQQRTAKAPLDRKRVPAAAVKALSPPADASVVSNVGMLAADQSGLAPLEAIDSDYAGAFFLINVAIDLGLYSHGITVVDDLDLSVWRFVEIVARELLADHDPEDPLWRLLASRAQPAGDPMLTDAGPDLPPAERDRLVARVRLRLSKLLDVEDPGGFLVRRRGRISQTPGHLDVRFPLEHHPIEIRLARLDRNPGWIPAAGVHIGFEFD